MTISIDVIPSSPTPINWAELKRRILSSVMDSEIQHLVGTAPRLIERQSKRSIDDAETLSLPGYYYFELARDNTLSLDLEPNLDGEGLSDYVDDFGRNLTAETKESIQEKWRRAGFFVSVSSYGGRAKHELDLLVKIAKFVAQLTNGVVVVMDNGVFARPAGIYVPDEFANPHV